MAEDLFDDDFEDDGGDRWFAAVEGFVVENEDPEKMHRIKCVIPAIDENAVYDRWVTALVPWVGKPGYGPVHLPEKGSEVVLFGRMGETHNLFYLSRFNEDYTTPEEFADGARGLKTDTAYKMLVDLLIEIISLQTILIQATEQADIKSAVVRLMGNDSEGVRVEPNKVGFLGAAPIARRALPPNAIDLPTNNALTNAIKQLLIDLGFAQ